MGGLATYELFSQYQELVGRMFGSFIEFKWNTTTKELLSTKTQEQKKNYYCIVTITDPDSELLKDYLSKSVD